MVNADIHLCDNYTHLLFATADLAAHPGRQSTLLYIDDALPLTERLHERLSTLVGAEIRRTSDDEQIEEYARLPSRLPAMLRRNISWSGSRPIRPHEWVASCVGTEHFDTGYVYHPGFFLSKVLAGRCDRIVMRDSGYANYVTHRVPLRRSLPRLMAGRSPRRQIWGEERWVDEIEVLRPDRLPAPVRHKAKRLALADLRQGIPDARARELASAFWGDSSVEVDQRGATALLLTQPIDTLGICSRSEKEHLYAQIAERLVRQGFHVVEKPHPREPAPVLALDSHVPARFPIEAWTWLGVRPFDLAVSLNSAALADAAPTFAQTRLQLLAPERFFLEYWSAWPRLIEQSFQEWESSLQLPPSVTTDPHPCR